MKDGVCAKCEAENVRLVAGNRTEVSIPVKGVFSTGAFASFYVCGRCGYVEIYVEKEEDLPKICEAWPQVRVKK